MALPPMSLTVTRATGTRLNPRWNRSRPPNRRSTYAGVARATRMPPPCPSSLLPPPSSGVALEHCGVRW